VSPDSRTTATADHEHVHDHVNVHVDVHVIVDVVGFSSRLVNADQTSLTTRPVMIEFPGLKASFVTLPAAYRASLALCTKRLLTMFQTDRCFRAPDPGDRRDAIVWRVESFVIGTMIREGACGLRHEASGRRA